jgi:Protein of unknown function (DUF1254)
MRHGFLGIGVEDNDVLAFPELMDSASLFLTANCDTMYFISFVDLSDGPMVIDLPALGPPTGILGAVDDMWFGWVTDTGIPGPDRGLGGRYLIVGPGYDGPLPMMGSTCRIAARLAVCGLVERSWSITTPRPQLKPFATGCGFTRTSLVGRGPRSRLILGSDQ